MSCARSIGFGMTSVLAITKEKMSSIHMPVLIMSGTDDTLAPPWMAKELYDRANQPTENVADDRRRRAYGPEWN